MNGADSGRLLDEGTAKLRAGGRPAGPAPAPVPPMARLLIAAAAVAAALLRFTQLDLRPLHSDEGGNYWFIKEVLERGIYPYSHENYHGPLFFYCSAIFVKWFGYGPEILRLFAAACGTAAALLPLLLIRTLRPAAAVVCAVFLAVSPSLIFYSRDAIHEMPFVLCGLLFAIFLYRLFEDEDKRWLFPAAAAAAALVALKETFVITGAAAAVAVCSVYSSRRILNTLYQFRRQAGRAAWAAAAAIIAVYSAAGRWTKGIIEMFTAVQQWFERGTSADTGHFKPFAYYLTDVIWSGEPLIIFGLAASAAAIIYRRMSPQPAPSKNPFYRNPADRFFRCWTFFLVFALILLAIYSAIPYKTPWLVINITAPSVIVLGCLIGWCFGLPQAAESAAPQRRRMAASALLFCAAAFSGWQAIGYNFRPADLWANRGYKPYGPGNPFSYVHTDDKMLEMVQIVINYKHAHPAARILVGVPGYWPLPYYLREFDDDCAYFVPDDPGSYVDEYDVIIAAESDPWRDERYSSEFFRLSDYQTGRLFLKKEPKQ